MDVRLKRCPCFLLGSFTCSYVLCQSIDSGWYWAIPFRQSTTDSVYCTCLFFLDGSVFASNASLPEKGGFVSFPFIFFRTHKPYLLVVSAARIGHCRPCPLHEQCQWHGTATKKPRRVSAVLVRTVLLLRRPRGWSHLRPASPFSGVIGGAKYIDGSVFNCSASNASMCRWN